MDQIGSTLTRLDFKPRQGITCWVGRGGGGALDIFARTSLMTLLKNFS